MKRERAILAVAGLAVLVSPWLHWYGPPNFLVLFGALDRLDPLVRGPRSAWEHRPALAAGLTVAGLVLLARAALPAARRLRALAAGVALAALVATVAGMVLRPRYEVPAGTGVEFGEAPLRAGPWVALAALVAAGAAAALAARRSER